MISEATTRTVYVPYMCDHSHVLAASLSACGQPAVVLPPPDDETLALGLEYCRGRECSPCLTVSGDIARVAQQPGFSSTQAVFLIPTTTGSCRFGQYIVLMRQILEQMGLSDITFIAPTANDSYQGLGDDPVKTRKLIWEGAVAVDLLQKLLHSYRPYELERGVTDAAYKSLLEDATRATRAGGGKHLVAVMQKAARDFAAIPVDRSVRRPLIGMVGEIYLRHNTYSNLDIIRRIESLGGEVELATMMEWIYYTNWGHAGDTWLLGQRVEWFKSVLTDRFQRYLEHRLVKPVAHLLDHPYESSIDRLMKLIKPYFSSELANECLLSMGKTIELAGLGASGMINVMPFACMPGIITAGMAPRIRADLGNLPWLDIAFDSQGGTNITTRLEAFMYQATEFKRRVNAA